MESQLLIRAYNVGLGDCIYVRVPDSSRPRHILIDCGNKFGSLDTLKACIEHLKADLPTISGKKHLDLLVVSHPHEDHHKGFEPEVFADIQIDRIWLSPAFNLLDPHAQGFHALQAAASRALTALSLSGLDDELSEHVSDLLALSTPAAIQALTHALPQANGIEPLYVTAATPASRLRLFKNKSTRLRILGPLEDIDGYYLGGQAVPPGDNSLSSGYSALHAAANPKEPNGSRKRNGAQARVDAAETSPRNISSIDFARLESGMMSNALALASLAGHITNNLSVVLLLEWSGQRFLFPGDAEWEPARGGAVQKGRSNGAWNLLWDQQRAQLSKPLSFLKVGHHGSENATPWSPEQHPINAVLDAMLPRPDAGKKPTARAVVSTLRTSRWPTIPNAPLLVELAHRLANTSVQYHDGSSPLAVPAGQPQPQRTDMEQLLAGHPVPFVELIFDPKS
jgi:beta-lactamase superfamily II metal-dependent hydrolase